MKPIYFDHASTTPVDPQVIMAMSPFFFEKFGNPSSPHAIGRDAQKALEDSRAIIANFIGAKSEEVVFTSSATESNNHAIFGIAQSLKNKGNHIIVSSIEHHSVLEPILELKRQGFDVTILPVDAEGLVDPLDVKNAITSRTILIAVIHASNEIGTIEPVSEIGHIAREHQIPFLVDAVQTFGQISVNVNDLKADLLTISGHKVYGPKGIGALYLRKGLNIQKLLMGGDQERDRRASTQNVAGAVGFAAAVKILSEKMNDDVKSQIILRDKLLSEIPERISGTKINGSLKDRLSKNAHFSFEGIDGQALLVNLDMAGIAASMGSACTSGEIKPSRVLKAIGLSDELAFGSLRLTLGRWTRLEDVEYLLEKLPRIIEQLRR